MVNFNVSSIGSQLQPPVARAVEPKPEAGKDSFGQWLSKSLGEVAHMQNEADVASQQLISGESKDIHNTMIQMQKANIAFELTMEIRNKVVAAYEEIKRMQF
jgi:flagellar hook-basal body complex protein FliE